MRLRTKLLPRSQFPRRLASLVRSGIVAIGGVIAIGGWSCSKNIEPSRGPHLVLIVIDTLRADHLESYGYSRETMPALDRLRQEGALFRNAFCQATWTGASMSSLFTSVYPSTHGFVDNHTEGGESNYLSDKLTTLTEVLEETGYECIGHVTNLYLSRTLGFDQGFDTFVEHKHLADADEVTDEVIGDLREWAQTREKPLFLYAHYMDPHSPYSPPEKYRSKFVSSEQDLLPQGLKVPIHFIMGSRDLNAYKDIYDREILFANDQIARIFTALDRLEITEETLVVVTADHGEEFFDHGRFGHGKYFFDETLRVPLVFRFPGRIEPGTDLEPVVELVDVMPTILELLGVPTPTPVQGESLTPLFDSTPAPEPSLPTEEIAYAELHIKGPPRIMARTRDWKAICSRENPAVLTHYYNLLEDPQEQTNLAHSLDPTRRDQLIARLIAWQDRRVEEGQGFQTSGGRQLSEDAIQKLRELGYMEEEPEKNESPSPPR